MKKLLSLSILAATLASTAVFAAPSNSGPSVDAKDVLLVQKQHAAPNVLAFAAIAQNAIDNSSPANTILKANFVLDQQQNLKQGVLVLANALQSNDFEAIQAAIVSGVREANGSNGAGWKFVKFVPGQGNGNIGVVYFIDGRKDNNTVKGIAIHAERNQVTFTQVAAAKAIADELTNSKNHAALAAAAAE